MRARKTLQDWVLEYLAVWQQRSLCYEHLDNGLDLDVGMVDFWVSV
jgi:hypothetical protein